MCAGSRQRCASHGDGWVMSGLLDRPLFSRSCHTRVIDATATARRRAKSQRADGGWLALSATCRARLGRRTARPGEREICYLAGARAGHRRDGRPPWMAGKCPIHCPPGCCEIPGTISDRAQSPTGLPSFVATATSPRTSKAGALLRLRGRITRRHDALVGCRLRCGAPVVIDTGMHAMGWSRDRPSCLRDNSALAD
jgi:hypothetical protein